MRESHCPKEKSPTDGAHHTFVIFSVCMALSVAAFLAVFSVFDCFMVRTASGPQKYLLCQTSDRGSSFLPQCVQGTLFMSTIFRYSYSSTG